MITTRTKVGLGIGLLSGAVLLAWATPALAAGGPCDISCSSSTCPHLG